MSNNTVAKRWVKDEDGMTSGLRINRETRNITILQWSGQVMVLSADELEKIYKASKEALSEQ